MSVDWTNVGDAVKELITLIDEKNYEDGGVFSTPRTFHLDSIRIRTEDDRLQVAAFDKNGKPFDYAIYLDGWHSETDGYN